jgi:hypothetical protein
LLNRRKCLQISRAFSGLVLSYPRAARVQTGTAKGSKSVLPHLAQSQDQRKAARALEPCARLEFEFTVGLSAMSGRCHRASPIRRSCWWWMSGTAPVPTSGFTRLPAANRVSPHQPLAFRLWTLDFRLRICQKRLSSRQGLWHESGMVKRKKNAAAVALSPRHTPSLRRAPGPCAWIPAQHRTT